jgi:sugar lactone lactonase YvrE
MMDQPMDELRAGKISGAVWEWHSNAGWNQVRGTEASGPNGLEISADGKWFYIGAWGSLSVIRVSRDKVPGERSEARTGFNVDNLRAAPDGTILVAGQGLTADSMRTANVARLDPVTLRLQEIVRYPETVTFKTGTVALQVAREIWVGSMRGERIARFPLQ